MFETNFIRKVWGTALKYLLRCIFNKGYGKNKSLLIRLKQIKRFHEHSSEK